jgi:hypothetical protein
MTIRSLLRPTTLRAYPLGLLAYLAFASTAQAEDADAAFKRGQDLAAQGKAGEAEAAFEIAWAERKAWDIAGNLGLVEAAQGKWTEAAQHLKFALDNVGGLAKPEHRAGLQSKFEEASSKVGELKITAPPGSTIKLANEEIGKTPLALAVYVNPGEVKVTASLPDHTDDMVTATVGPGQSRDVPLNPVPIEGKGPVSPGGEPLPMWPGFVIGGVGVAAAVAGGVLLGVGHSKLGDADTLGAEIQTTGGNCLEIRPGPCQELQSTLDDASSMNTAGVVMTVAGGALIVGGVLYLVIPDRSTDTALIPILTDTQVGLSFGGTFQ